jgi:hypothetical protein
MNDTLTPTYNALREKVSAEVERDRDRGLHPVTVAGMQVISKAITSGQRAGQRASDNVWRHYEYEPFGSYDSSTIARRANAAASAASTRARERYVVKNWPGA